MLLFRNKIVQPKSLFMAQETFGEKVLVNTAVTVVSTVALAVIGTIFFGPAGTIAGAKLGATLGGGC